MNIDLQKLTIKRLLSEQNHDFFTKLSPYFFSGANSSLYNKVESYYKANLKIPSEEEFYLINKDASAQEYFETQIVASEKYADIDNDFIIAQLQDHFVREETISFLDSYIDQLEDLEKIEIVDKIQSHLLKLNSALPTSDELFDVADLDFFPQADDFKLYPSGLSAEYDAINGGFGSQELVLLGGRRGSGKSIISLNCSVNRFLQGSTVAFFSIEMRYKEVHDRLLSIISDVPFLDIYKNKLSEEQKLKLAKSKLDYFFDNQDQKAIDYYTELEKDRDFSAFEQKMKFDKPEYKENRFFIIDDAGLTLNRIDHYCNMFQAKYPRYTMACVDYINIIRHEDQKDWKSQITIAENLKLMSRKYDLTMFSPYQIDAGGEARFAKGILDSADRSFNFFPPDENNDPNRVAVHTTKIRNGRTMNFDIGMNWECTKVVASDSNLINEKPFAAARYGSEEDKQPKRTREIERDL